MLADDIHALQKKALDMPSNAALPEQGRIAARLIYEVHRPSLDDTVSIVRELGARFRERMALASPKDADALCDAWETAFLAAIAAWEGDL
jgi:hypothetical protein